MRLWRISLLMTVMLWVGMTAVMALQAQETPVDPFATPEVMITDEIPADVPLTEETVILTQELDSTPEFTSETMDITPEQTEIAATPASTEALQTLQEYTVVRGDTLRIIAERYQTTIEALVRENGIVNPDIIYIGQILRIPNAAAVSTTEEAASASPTPTLMITPAVSESRTAGGSETYTIREGDTLAKIAVQFNTTVEALRVLNNLENPNRIYSGQTLVISGEGTSISSNTTGIAGTSSTVQTNSGFDYGIYLDIHGQDPAQVVAQAEQLGVDWVRIDVKWRDIEATQGQADFSILDPLVSGFDQAGFNILLTVSAAPSWARTSQTEDGPPDNPTDFASFMSVFSTHYLGVVDAYQIWNEPNLRREWNSTRYPLSAQFYVDLLRPTYEAIKAVDPNALIITAGLAPTGFNDGINAINDRQYLEALYESGVTEVSDAMGASIGGWANPPDATCCTASEGVETHFEDRSFYFKDTLDDYQRIMREYGDTRPLWVTKFGWGTSEDTTSPDENTIYFSYTDLQEQANYVVRAFELGEQERVGPMFLNNLDGCVGNNVWQERCYYSLITADGTPRPVFEAVAAMNKSQ
jgi:polysaccharide biosynthesis protein PslG